MKFFLLIIVWLTGSVFAEVKWNSSLMQGMKIAKDRNVPIVLDIYTDWCGYCKVLEEKIFPNKEVALELENFSTVRINGERYPNLVQHYQIKSYPTVLFLDKNGTLLDKIEGLPTSKLLTQKLKDVYKLRDYEQVLLSKLEKDPEDPQLNFTTGVYYYNSGNKKKASGFFHKAYYTEREFSTTKKHDSLYNLGLVNIELEDYKSAEKNWTQYIDKFPAGDMTAARYYRGLANSMIGNKMQAKEDLTKALEITQDPSDKAKIEEMLKALEQD